MPLQYVNSRFSLILMSTLRCFWSALYLWMMMHASAIVPIAYERWDTGFFWNSRLPDKLMYKDPLAMIPNAELWILLMIFAVIKSLYVSFCYRPRLLENILQLENQPRLNCAAYIPYMVSFLGSWLFTTYVTAHQLAIWSQMDTTSVSVFCHLVMAFLFKILVMANFSSLCLRVYSSMLKHLSEWERGHILELDFGQRLDELFRN